MSEQQYPDVIEVDKADPKTWAHFMELSQKKKTKTELPDWVADKCSKQEAAALVVKNGTVYRPFCTLDHPEHAFYFLLDYGSALAVQQRWNCRERRKDDRIELKIVMFSSIDNKTDRR